MQAPLRFTSQSDADRLPDEGYADLNGLFFLFTLPVRIANLLLVTNKNAFRTAAAAGKRRNE
ncbi:MAG: hypothetical protein VR64_21825 [Desulfatitalea sp. BRH_c12]|nr:MAG: hypothetical protein VR64_21825 [Desulfatitalea sp. BRH_c12]